MSQKILKTSRRVSLIICNTQHASFFFSSSPVLAVDDLEVHVDARDKHLTVDAHLVDGGRRQGVRHHHHAHDLVGRQAAVRQGHADAQAARHVDHLRDQTHGGQFERLPTNPRAANPEAGGETPDS